MNAWLDVRQGPSPLIISLPHVGTSIPPEIERDLSSPWLARKDTDWSVDRLYDFAADLGATLVRTGISRTVIDVNRDPSGASLYPGQTTTDLCPVTTFDGEPLYREGLEPCLDEIARRRQAFFDPYHAALRGEMDRLRSLHARIVLYDAHAIRSVIPRLFNGTLPNLNIGTDGGRTADGTLIRNIEDRCRRSRFSHVTNGRFRGGWTARHYGNPARGIHAVQMEIACRSYLDEPAIASDANWPAPVRESRAAELRALLKAILEDCIRYAGSFSHEPL